MVAINYDLLIFGLKIGTDLYECYVPFMYLLITYIHIHQYP